MIVSILVVYCLQSLEQMQLELGSTVHSRVASNAPSMGGAAADVLVRRQDSIISSCSRDSSISGSSSNRSSSRDSNSNSHSDSGNSSSGSSRVNCFASAARLFVQPHASDHQEKSWSAAADESQQTSGPNLQEHTAETAAVDDIAAVQTAHSLQETAAAAAATALTGMTSMHIGRDSRSKPKDEPRLGSPLPSRSRQFAVALADVVAGVAAVVRTPHSAVDGWCADSPRSTSTVASGSSTNSATASSRRAAPKQTRHSHSPAPYHRQLSRTAAAAPAGEVVGDVDGPPPGFGPALAAPRVVMQQQVPAAAAAGPPPGYAVAVEAPPGFAATRHAGSGGSVHQVRPVWC